jgi:antirestriction protein
MLSRTKISKRKLKAFEKEQEKVKTSVKKHIEPEYAEPTRASKKLLDMCGNPRIKFHRGKLTKKSLKEIKKYSKLHCVQW